MRQTLLTLLLTSSLILAAFASFGVSDSADALASEHDDLRDFHAVSKLYFPAVPNDAAIGDTGPWHGSITVQSMERSQIEVFVMPDGRFDPARALMSFSLLSSFDSRTITAGEIGIPEGELSSVVIMAIDQEVWRARGNPDGLAAAAALGYMQPKVVASLKMASPTEMEEGVWTGSAHDVVDGYSAIPMNDVGWGSLTVDCPSADLNGCADIRGLGGVDGTSYLPLAQTNNDWNTNLYVTNVEGAIDGDSLVEVELIPSDGSDNEATWLEVASLGPGETWEIDVLEAVGSGWTGSVRITSDAGTAAIAARHKPSTDMMLLNTSGPSRSDSGDGYQLNAPLIFVDWGGWNTGISISNQSGSSNTIEVTFYGGDGAEAGEASQTIPGNGHGYIYLPSEVDPSEQGWYGSAVLRSANNAPFHAAVDQVNYYNGAAMSYTVGARGAVSVERTPERDVVGLPLAQLSASPPERGDTSGIQLFNPHPDEAVGAEIRLHVSGADSMLEIELGPLESYSYYLPDEFGTSEDTTISVTVTATRGDGEVVAVSNLVNYNVQGDGALVFSLSNGSGQFR